MGTEQSRKRRRYSPQLKAQILAECDVPGASVAKVAMAHGTAFGEKGVSAEQVAGALVKEVRAYQASEGVLGQHLADQWMLPLALAVVARGGEASFTCTEMTEHATTNMAVIEQFLPVRFDVESTGACPRVRVVAAANA